MECVVYRRGEPVGTLCIEDEGLYRVLTARIRPYRELLRLYLPEPMGVFVPEDNALVCRRRISRARLPEVPICASAWCETDGLWTPEAEGQRYRYVPEGMEQAVLWQTQSPMRFPAPPDQLTPITLEGRQYLTYLFRYRDQVMMRRMV